MKKIVTIIFLVIIFVLIATFLLVSFKEKENVELVSKDDLSTVTEPVIDDFQKNDESEPLLSENIIAKKEILEVLNNEEWVKENINMKNTCFGEPFTESQRLTYEFLSDDLAIVEAFSYDEQFGMQLFLIGYKDGNINVISYPEESPAHPGHGGFRINTEDMILVNCYGHMDITDYTAYKISNLNLEEIEHIRFESTEEFDEKKLETFLNKYKTHEISTPLFVEDATGSEPMLTYNIRHHLPASSDDSYECTIDNQNVQLNPRYKLIFDYNNYNYEFEIGDTHKTPAREGTAYIKYLKTNEIFFGGRDNLDFDVIYIYDFDKEDSDIQMVIGWGLDEGDYLDDSYDVLYNVTQEHFTSLGKSPEFDYYTTDGKLITQTKWLSENFVDYYYTIKNGNVEKVLIPIDTNTLYTVDIKNDYKLNSCFLYDENGNHIGHIEYGEKIKFISSDYDGYHYKIQREDGSIVYIDTSIFGYNV